MAIDLSKLKLFELPKKEIEIDILGEKQKVTVSAHSDAELIRIFDIKDTFKGDSSFRIRKLLLSSCVEGMTEDDAEMLISKCYPAAAVLLDAIFELTDEFEKARNAERESAEKN